MPIAERTVIRPAPPFHMMIDLLSRLDEYMNRARPAVHDDTKANYRIFGVLVSHRGDAPDPEFSHLAGHEIMPAPWVATTYAAREIKSTEAYREAIERFSSQKMKTIDKWDDRPMKWNGMIAIRERGIRFVPQVHFDVRPDQDLELNACHNVIDKSMEQDVAKIIEDALHIFIYEDFPVKKPKESYKIPMSKGGRLG